MFRSILVGTTISFFVSFAFAGECVLHVTREGCAGKEAESYKKCGGKKECDESKKAKDAAMCAALAEADCANFGARQKLTKSKTITAKFDGVVIEGGKNFCPANRADFNKCDK